MITLILTVVGLMLFGSLAMAVVCAFLEHRAWSDFFDNERDD